MTPGQSEFIGSLNRWATVVGTLLFGVLLGCPADAPNDLIDPVQVATEKAKNGNPWGQLTLGSRRAL